MLWLVRSYVGSAMARFLKASRSRKSAGSMLRSLISRFRTKQLLIRKYFS